MDHARPPSTPVSTALECAPYDIIIVGAGILGTALAIPLARSGRRVLLIERDLAPPHSRIVGELLQVGGCIALDRLGLLDALEGIDAQPCEGYFLIDGKSGATAHLRYPPQTQLNLQRFGLDKRMLNSPLSDAWNSTPNYQGRSFHHGRFVGALRRLTIGVDNLHVLEATVNDLVHCQQAHARVIGVKCTPRETGVQVELLAPLTIVADGYASKFRKLVNPNAPQPIARSYFVGLELDHCSVPQPRHGHVLLPSSSSSSSQLPSSTPSSQSTSSPPATIGPILVYALCSKTTRMLIDVPTHKTPSRAYLLEHIPPRLPKSMLPSFLEALSDANPQKVKSMPNSFLPPSMQGSKSALEGVLLAGDAMNMRHPLTGGGMSVALNDAVILSQLLGAGGDILGSSSSLNSTPSVTLSNGQTGHAHADGHANGHANGLANGHANGHSNGDVKRHVANGCAGGNGAAHRDVGALEHLNGAANGHANGNAKGHTNGHALGVSNGELKNDSLSSSASEDNDAEEDDVDSIVFGSHSNPCDLSNWLDVRSRLQEWHWRRKGVATCVNVLAMALYALFSAADENLDVLKSGCFNYIRSGGARSEDPVSLLAALNPSPSLLLYHFFAVAFYSIHRLFTAPRPSSDGGKPRPPTFLEYPGLAVQSVMVFWTACVVILPVLWTEVDF